MHLRVQSQTSSECAHAVRQRTQRKCRGCTHLRSLRLCADLFARYSFLLLLFYSVVIMAASEPCKFVLVWSAYIKHNSCACWDADSPQAASRAAAWMGAPGLRHAVRGGG